MAGCPELPACCMALCLLHAMRVLWSLLLRQHACWSCCRLLALQAGTVCCSLTYYKHVKADSLLACLQVVPPEQLPADLDPLSLRLTGRRWRRPGPQQHETCATWVPPDHPGWRCLCTWQARAKPCATMWTMCNHVQPCPTMCNHVDHVQPCATMCNHVEQSTPLRMCT
jgi:hypothetical protein